MFDYQGIFTRAQWTVLQSFITDQKTDIVFRKNHLTKEKDRLKKLRKKLFKADTALGGTSLLGNAGDQGSAGTNRIISEGTVDAQAVIAELRPLNPTRFPPPPAGNTPTVMGGDKPWKDDPIDPQKLIISNSGGNDASNAIIVEDLKLWVLKQIKRRRERFEYKLKKICDLIEQIESEIDLLDSVLVAKPTDKYSDYILGRTRVIEGRFGSFVFKNKTLFETAEDTRTFPVISDTFADADTIGEPSKPQSVISAEVDAETTAKSAPKKKPQGFGFSGG